MIKRDTHYIIRRIITAVAIAFILFFLKSNNVLAATSVSSYHYRLDYLRGQCHTYSNQQACTWDTNNGYILSSFIPFGTSTNPQTLYGSNYSGSLNSFLVRRFYVRLDTGTSSSTDFTSGQIYTLKFTLNLAPRPTDFYSNINRNIIIQTWNGTTYVDNTAEILTVDITQPSDNYGTNVVITFRVNIQTRYVLFTIGLLDSLKRVETEGVNFKSDASTQVSSDANIQAIYDSASAIINSIISQTTEIIDSAATNNTNLNDIKSLLLSIINVTYNNIYTGGLAQFKSDLESGQATGGSGMNGLVGLPGTFINAYINGFNGTCQSVNFGSLYGTNLYLPCIDPSDTLGPIWNIIDLLFSTFMIYNISRRFVQMFNKFTNLESDQVNDLYGGGV